MADAKIAKLSKELYENQSSLNPELFGDTGEDDLFKPALADDVKVGYFNLDRACQTQQTDIVQLKEMTSVLQVLIKDSSHIKRDLTLTRKKLETEYETKLQEKSSDLYNRINHKLGELEAMHVERVGIVRRAYRQQLADALARVETLFQARFEKQMEKDKERHQAELKKLQQQIASFTQTIQRNESVIIMLKQQLATKQKAEEKQVRAMRKALSRVPVPSLDCATQCDLGLSPVEEAQLRATVLKLRQYYEKNEQRVSATVQADILAVDSHVRSLGGGRRSTRKLTLPPPREDTTKIDALTKQMETLKDQLKHKDKEIGSMEDELDSKNAEITATIDRCNKLQNELEKESILKSQLAMELSEVKSQADKSSLEAKKMKDMASDLEKQRQEMEAEAEEKARKAREEALGATGQKMKEMQAEFAQKIGELMKQKEALEAQLANMTLAVSLRPDNEPKSSKPSPRAERANALLATIDQELNIDNRKLSVAQSANQTSIANKVSIENTTDFSLRVINIPGGTFGPSESLAPQKGAIQTITKKLSLEKNLTESIKDVNSSLHSSSTQLQLQQSTSQLSALPRPTPSPTGRLGLPKPEPTGNVGFPKPGSIINESPSAMLTPELAAPLSPPQSPSATKSEKIRNKSEEAVKMIINNPDLAICLQQYLIAQEQRKSTPPQVVVEKPETDVDRLIKSERELRVHVEKLKREIERINRAWEKKFTILQASLYALKDESYLRQHLEKQHTTLHQATISYTAGPPKAGRRRPVLPSIPNRAASPDPLASYTVSRASNRHVLENQIISDDDDGEDVVYGQDLAMNTHSRFSSQSIAN